MFDRIAPVYDSMNRAMTGLDQRWRRLAATAVVRPGDRVLDACCGTGDLALAAAAAGAEHVVGLDFSPRMLDLARRKSEHRLDRGRHARAPFEPASFDAVTVGFGVRNVDDLEAAAEPARLAPGGRLAVLEITRPRGLLRPFFRLWFDVLVPFAGRVLPGGEAYTYLPASVRRFPAPRTSRPRSGAAVASVRFRTLAGDRGRARRGGSVTTLLAAPSRSWRSSSSNWMRRYAATPAWSARSRSRPWTPAASGCDRCSFTQ